MKIVDHREANLRVPLRELSDGAHFESQYGEVYSISGRTGKLVRVHATQREYEVSFLPDTLVTPLIVHYVEELHIDGEGVA